jgi:hypothetical protein
MSFEIRHFCGFALLAALWLLSPAARAQDTLDQTEEGLRPYVMPRTGPFRPDEIGIANAAAISAWARSGHSDAASRAFSNWNAAGEIPAVCAVCHSGAGFRAFHGLDVSEPGLDHPIPTGGVVDCETCHNPGLSRVQEIRLPNGVMHPVTPGEAPCMTCHQSRAAGATITAAVGEREQDTPDPSLGFVGPHYGFAATTWLGSVGGGGYQYPGRSYSGRFFHARPVATCVSCHDPHSLAVAEANCLTCHENGKPRAIRISRQSFDGSGDTTRGIAADVAANTDRLSGMIGRYAEEVAGVPIVYESGRPYFFADANRDGRADVADGSPVAYPAWTPRLMKAAYNWIFVKYEPGAYVHNPHYALELLHDSMEDLAGPLQMDVSDLSR